MCFISLQSDWWQTRDRLFLCRFLPATVANNSIGTGDIEADNRVLKLFGRRCSTVANFTDGTIRKAQVAEGNKQKVDARANTRALVRDPNHLGLTIANRAIIMLQDKAAFMKATVAVVVDQRARNAPTKSARGNGAEQQQ